MKRGTKPKPTHLRVIQGQPRHAPLNKHEPLVVGNLSDPPEWMTDTQKDGWRYAIEHAPQGLLKMLDRGVLEIWVVADDLHRDASQRVAKHGLLVRTPLTKQWVQSPFLAIKNKQALICLRAAAELGFTPSSRSQIVSDHAAGNAFSNNGRTSSRSA